MKKRIDRAERRQILRALGRATLAISALIDGATPTEIAHATECVVDLADTFHRAMQSLVVAEPEPDEGAP